MYDHVCTELVVPVIIDKVTIDTPFGREILTRRIYHNTIVGDLQSVKYTLNQWKEDNYIRNVSINRCCDEDVIWPEHPLTVNGQMLGAIIIIQSKDNKVLLVRNNKLWGLPKGARNYIDFMKCKKETDDQYLSRGSIIEHTEANFTEDNIESAIDNVCRETLEETGIVLNVDNIQSIYSQINNKCAYDGFYYMYPKNACDHIDDLNKNGTDHENDELLWIDLDELSQWLYDHRSPKHPKIFNHVTYGFLANFMHTY
jgi:8-oxo-dGTP pyrophosphatase MutT (NUDIX family)